MPLLPSGPDGVNGLSSRGASAVNASHAVDCMFDRGRALFLRRAQPFNHACTLEMRLFPSEREGFEPSRRF
jgi:hypothetical protein